MAEEEIGSFTIGKGGTTTAAVFSLDGQPSSTACPHCGHLLMLVLDLRLEDTGRAAQHSTEVAPNA